MNDRNTNHDFTLIDNQAELDGLCKKLAEVHRVAVDTEADSLYHYFEKVCLIQLTLPVEHEANFVIDPLSGIDLSGLLDILASMTIVFHGADYDLRMLRTSYGFRPQGQVHDTMLAAQLLGHPHPGLASLMKEHFGRDMPKGSQKADWSARPLSPKLLRYAANDTRHLLELADLLLDKLRAHGREDWYAESCQKMIDSTAKDQQRDPDTQWRIPGAGQLSRCELALLRQLWHWRQEQAKIIDRPPFRVLHNAELTNLCTWLAQDRMRSAKNHPRLNRKLKDYDEKTLLENVERAWNLEPNDRPEKRCPTHRPDAGPLLQPLRKATADLAASLGLSPPLLAPKAALVAIARAMPANRAELQDVAQLMNWQADILETALRGVLNKYI